jgi:aspartyl protease family protein
MEDINGDSIDLSSLCGGGNSGGSGIGRSTNSSQFQVQIKRRESGIPVIDVTLNGQKTYEMLLDTGASGTVLTPKMAQELNLKPEGVVLGQTASSNAVRFETTMLNSIQVGDNRVNNLKVAVSPNLSIGLLGQDFFGKFDLTIKEKVIEFKRRF